MQEVLADLEAVEQGLTPTAVTDEVRRNTTKNSVTAAGTGGYGRSTASNNSALTMDVGDIALPKKNTGLIIGGVGALGIALAAVLWLTGGSADKQSVTAEPQKPTTEVPVAQPTPELGPPPKAEEAPPKVDEPKSEPPPLPVVQVALSSKPDAVEVFSAGALIGHTPLTMPRPKAGEPAVELILRADGYKDLALRITEFSQDKLSVELDKERRRGGAAPARPNEPEKPQRTPDSQPENPQRRPRPQTEVLDPWG
jgi:hypothetical protein